MATLDREERDSFGPASWILLALLAAAPPVFATGFASFEMIKSALFGVGGAVALAVWGVERARRGRLRLVAGRAALLGAAFVVYAVVAAAWSPGWLAAAPTGAFVVALGAVYLITTAPGGRGIDFPAFAAAVAVGAGLAGLGGLLDWAGVGFFTAVWDPPGPTGVFDSVEVAAAYYAVALPVVAGGVLRADSGRRGALAVAFAVAALHAGTVMGWLAVALMGAAAVVSWGLARGLAGRVGGGALTPALGLLAFVGLVRFGAPATVDPSAEQNASTSIPSVERESRHRQKEFRRGNLRNAAFATGRTESVRTQTARRYLWQVGRRYVEDRPLLGHGPGGWWHLQTKYPVEDHPQVERLFLKYPAYRSPHNLWLRLAVDYGTLGLVLFLLWLVTCGSVSLMGWREVRDQPGAVPELWALWTAALAGLSVGSVTNLFELAPSALVWVGSIGVLVRRSSELADYRAGGAIWAAGGDDPMPGAGRLAVGAVAVSLAAGTASVVAVETVGDLYRSWGDQLMLRTRYERAAERYRTADRWFPARGDVLYNVALAASRAGTLGDERRALERAHRLRPHDARVSTLMATASLSAGDVEAAVRRAREAVEHHPNNIEARKLLAAALRRRGKPDAAADALLRLIERRPPEALRARLHFQLGQLYAAPLEVLDRAKEHFKRAKALTDESSITSSIDESLKKVREKIEREREKREGEVPAPPGMEEVPDKLPVPPSE